MITSLELKNFRRHTHTVLDFSSEDQLILIGGKNGAGKSTLISESLLWALFGHTKNGRKGIDGLVRRGAELEGMEVTVGLTIDGKNYSITRRREGNMTSAVLSQDGVDLVETAREVTQKVSNLLGMDAEGFKLAILSQQKELMGLTNLTSTERTKVLAKLLRLDAIEKARNELRTTRNTRESILKGMGQGKDLEQLNTELEAIKATYTGVKAQVATSESDIEKLRERIRVGEDVNALRRQYEVDKSLYVRGRENALRAIEGKKSSLRDIEELPDIKYRQLDIIQKDLDYINSQLKSAYSSQLERNRLLSIREEAFRLEKTLNLINEHRDEKELAKTKLKNTEEDLVKLEASLEHARQMREKKSKEEAVLIENIIQLQARMGALGGAEGTCDTCGQIVTEEHQKEQGSAYSRQLKNAEKTLKKLTETVNTLTKKEQAVQQELHEKEFQQESITRSIIQLDAEIDRSGDIERHYKTYSLQLMQGIPDEVNIQGLEKDLQELEQEAEKVRTYEQKVNLRKFNEERNASLLKDIRELLTEIESYKLGETEVNKKLEGLTGDEDLVNMKQTLTEEQNLLNALSQEKARLEERGKLLSSQIKEVKSFNQTRKDKVKDLQVHGLAIELLTDLHKHMSTELRPQLAGNISDLLNKMTEGRFTSVEVCEDYEILIEDDGKMRPLADLSGGEVDLVALALRLSMASAVSKRPGVGSVGFLVLDEIFGSQDLDRRRSLVNALRSLRGEYDQIFIISHVGGIDDEVDKVVNIEIEGSERKVVVEVS